MLTIKKLLYFLFLIIGLVACENKSKKSIADNMGSTIENIKLVQSKLNYNMLELSDFDLKVEVVYKIDEENAIYEEWVKVNHIGKEKVTYFKFNFPKKNYLDFKLNESIYYSTFASDKRAVKLTDEQIALLELRFGNEIPNEVFEKVKDEYQTNNVDSKLINKYDNSCQNDWNKQRQTVIDYYNVGFQQCYYSKYSELAQEDARLFLDNNRYLSYRRLFGLDLVFPQIATNFELNKDGDSFLSIVTAYSPSSYFVRSDLNKKMGEDCKGQFIHKNTSDVNKNKNLFMGSYKDPVFIDAHYFLRACGRQYELSKSLVGTEINNLYPNTSQFFKEEIARKILTNFNIETIDKKISFDFDAKIERYNFLLENYNDSTLAEIYQNWKKNQIKEFDIRFEAYLPIGSFDNALDNYNFLKLVTSNSQARSRFFGDGTDLFLSEDLQAVLDLEKYVFLVDILEN